MAGRKRPPTGTYRHDCFKWVYFTQGLAVYRSWQASVAAVPGAAWGLLQVEALLSFSVAIKKRLEKVV